jgi:hypothetical protein
MVSISILSVEKNGEVKATNVRDFNDDYFVTCKKTKGAIKQTEWVAKVDGVKYIVTLYAKDSGKANTENKYDFPPPVDTKLFFGVCFLVAKTISSDLKQNFVNLTVPLWSKIYEKLFGGFEDLGDDEDDEEDEDELDSVPKDKKTKKGGYLKDGFVVDSSDAEDEEDCGTNSDSDSDDEEDDDDDDDEKEKEQVEEEEDDEETAEEVVEEIAEEEYDYSDLKPTKCSKKNK